MRESDGTNTERLPLSDVLASHLTGCEQCQGTLKRKPVANLAGAGVDQHCEVYWTLILEHAEWEGRVNNVVAHDEYGNEARKP